MVIKQQMEASLCKQAPGTFAPAIDRNRCEGKAECVSVCPKTVFAIDVLSKSERRKLSVLGVVAGEGFRKR
jgi:hypothetical protein